MKKENKIIKSRNKPVGKKKHLKKGKEGNESDQWEDGGESIELDTTNSDGGGSDGNLAVLEESRIRKRTTCLSQFLTINVHHFRQSLKEVTNIILQFVKFVTTPVIIAFLCSSLHNNYSGNVTRIMLIGFVLTVISLYSAIHSGNLLVKEHMMMAKHMQSGLMRSLAYISSILVRDTVLFRLIPGIIVGITLSLMMTSSAEQWWETVARHSIFVQVVVLVSLISAVIGILVKAAVPNHSRYTTMIIIIILVLNVFNGVFVNRGILPRSLRWIFRASFLSYACDALLINQFKGALVYISDIPSSAISNSTSKDGYINGDFILMRQKVDPDMLVPNLIILRVIYILLILTLCFVYSVVGKRRSK